MTQWVKLHEIAHARAGDKGNRLNISLIPYDDAHWPLLLEQVSAQKVKAWFAHRGATQVVRYELPNLKALNFVIDNVLEGGVNTSLNLDKHGKSNSFRLLDMPVQIETHKGDN
ncbi:hypothetical protein CAP48_06280 [Advenella sp. S44]|uniref:AtuA-related protein n=1 Tax=Advenella sp. S44 TaxID=1982755 RepID=UPI000C29CC97|nr:hypothetical protein [Advenella sp. S44]PJX25647.1 hypothetical protein CAP48_06280 [Advenella sp. S44]